MHVSAPELRERIKRKNVYLCVERHIVMPRNSEQEDKRLIIILGPGMSSDSHQIWMSIDNESNQVS